MPDIEDLPAPPPGKTGWPWTEECPKLPDTRLDGTSWPRISIVTPSYNQGRYIEETVRSILLQGYPNLEYIVMDGGSTDQTVSILRKYDQWIDFWESRSDNGQPDAINKGLERATGVWFQNINSDDVLRPDTLSAVGSVPTETDVICGDVLEISDDGSTWLVQNRRLELKHLLRQRYRSERISWHQPGVFLKTDHLRELGGYDIRFQYVFDLHLTCRYLERFDKIVSVGRPLVNFRIHDDAKSSSWKDRYKSEEILVRMALSEELLNLPNKRLAAFEEHRRRAMQLVAKSFDPELQADALAELIPIIRAHPSLLGNRMIWGSIRRLPRNWISAVFDRADKVSRGGS